MISECRAYYRNDPIQSAQINEFERNYELKDAIRWYTKPGFLFYLVNKALRSQDMWALYKFRYYIMDLSYFLEQISTSQSLPPIRLYRGAKLNRIELEQLQVGCLVSTNGFFSCSTDRHVAEMFLGIDPNTHSSSNYKRDASQQSVLFIIDVDCTVSEKNVVADISRYSDIPDENEMIFNFGSTFIINEIRLDTDKCIWCIQMSSSSDAAQINEGYEKYIHTRLQHINPIIMLGHVLANIGGDLGHWMNYFNRLLRILPIDHAERPNVFYVLGNIFRFIEKFQKSLHCYRCARLLVRRMLPERMFDYIRIIGGMGNIYSYLGDSKQGLKLLEQALELQKKSFPDNHTEIPFHLNLMGHAYFRATQYDRALLTLEKAKKFFEEKIPIELQGYAHTLHLMGLVYRALGSDDEALIAFQAALRRRYSLLDNKTCAHYEVPHSNHCYYLDGSGGQCAKGYKRASEAVLKTIATKFKGKTYKSKVSDNCCVWTSNTYENWGMPATSCNVPGTFESGPVLGGSLCTQAQQHFPAQLTFCGSS
ncbi:unnamed protein product [Rotaria sp. Silwood1]|nr:unnamed protein product [Rotaria sp. Silwood1]